MEEAINTQLKRSILSLFPRRRRPKARAHSLAAKRKPGLTVAQPQERTQPRSVATRRRSPHSGYVRGHYLPCARRMRARQPLFRVA